MAGPRIDSTGCRQGRTPSILAESTGKQDQRRVHIVSLNQDLADSVGHPLAYDSQLRSVCGQRGVRFISAANTRISPDLLQLHPYIRTVFRDRSSAIGRVTDHTKPPAQAIECFRQEVSRFLDEYLSTCNPEDKVILYLYTGGLAHVEALHDIVKVLGSRVSAHINLFWCSWINIRDEAFSERWAETLRKGLREPKLVLTVPTYEMQGEIEEAARVILPVAPMPSTTFGDLAARSVLEESALRLLENTDKAYSSVLFPSLMRKPKGYDLAISIIHDLTKKQSGTQYQCTLRYIPLEATPSKLVKLAEKARGVANIVEGVLERGEFIRMLVRADIIVLPYQPSEFSNRTSGILIDALLCGVPVVVQEGTWLGNLVTRYDCGALAETPRPTAYIRAIELVSANRIRYRSNAVNAGKDWLATNNWETLLDFILEAPPPLDIAHGGPIEVSQGRSRNSLRKVARRAAARMRSLRRMSLYRRLVDYMKRTYPSLITVGRFGLWSLERLKKSFFGIGGIGLLVVVGLLVVAALVAPLRWYLVGIAIVFLLLCGGLLALSYVRLMLARLVTGQGRAGEAIRGDITRDLPLIRDNQVDELEKRIQWRTLKNRYRGQRAFLIGNGPSLNRTPLHLLKDEFTLCFNRFDLMFERLGWRPTMYMCVDDRVAEHTASQISEIVPFVKFAFFPDIHPYGLDFRRFIEDAHNIYWLSLKSVCSPGCYETLPTCTTIGTVADLGLQVLAFMGFSPIYLVGVDLDYRKHETVLKHDGGNWTATQDDDPSHFDPRYFGAGAKYHEPSPHSVLISGFQNAKGLLDEKCIRVLNAGVGGALEIFPRAGFRSLFDFGEDAELEMLLSAVPPVLRQDALRALRGDRVVEARDDWDEGSPLQVTTLKLAEQLIPVVIFTHIPYGPFGNRHLFIRRESACSAGATEPVE